MSPKKYQKIEKILGQEVVKELESLSIEDLKHKLVHSEKAIKSAIDELEANAEYNELKESVKAMEAGMKEVRKYQNAIIQLSLHFMEEKGD